MKIMSINSGSSSVKVQLFEMPQETLIAKFSFEKIGFENSFGTVFYNNLKFDLKLDKFTQHQTCIKEVLNFCLEHKIIKDIYQIDGVGHRVVMGASYFNKSILINQEVEEKIKSLFSLAPLHNPANYNGIISFKKLIKNLKQVACFDTAYHTTLPPKNRVYPINLDYKNKHLIQKYGAHGISVNYVVNKYAQIKNKKVENLNVIVAHIGSGASISAIKNGKTLDTSMGYSPLGGIVMGTRSGDLDPSVVLKLVEIHNGDYKKVLDILNKESGVLGISGLWNDMRDIEDNYQINENAKLAFDIFCQKIVNFIGMYAINFDSLDAIILCAGVGEKSPMMQNTLKPYLKNIGVDVLEKNKSEIRNNFTYLSKKESKIDYLVIPTNEELMIAQDTYKILNGDN